MNSASTILTYRRVLGSAVLTIGLLAAAPHPGHAAGGGHKEHPDGRDVELSDEDRAWVERMQQATNDAKAKIQATHELALRHTELQKTLQSLRESMEAEMVRIAPTMQPTIERRWQVFQEMMKLQTAESPSQDDAERVNELTVEYHELTQELGALPQQALVAESVKQKQEAYKKHLMEVMIEINPEVPALMQKQKDLVAEFVAYREEMMKRHNKQLPASAQSTEDAQTTAAP